MVKIHHCAFSKANILSGFGAAGLVPFDPERVLAKLNIKKFKTPTPSSSSSSNQSFYWGKTPANLYKLEKQKQQIHDLQHQSLSYGVVVEQNAWKGYKSAEMAMRRGSSALHVKWASKGEEDMSLYSR